MAMPVVKVKNLNNEEVGQLELSEEVFGTPLNRRLIYYVLKCYLANQRAGTTSTKTRGQVSGSGRKPWRQKGTGRARVGSIRTPLWRGGGTVHGPKPRDWYYQVPKKMRRSAICSVLSERLREGNLVVLEDFEVASHRTKELAATLQRLGLGQHKTLIVDSLENHNLALSSRNMPAVKHISPGDVNLYELLVHRQLVLTRRAALELEERLGK
jgi:large subunit ribosomal protein L4